MSVGDLTKYLVRATLVQFPNAGAKLIRARSSKSTRYVEVLKLREKDRSTRRISQRRFGLVSETLSMSAAVVFAGIVGLIEQRLRWE